MPYASSLPGERNKAFVELYATAYKEKPGKYGAAGYNSMNILLDAIARAGKTDADAIRDALRKTDYLAPNGRYRFTDKGEGYGFDVALVQIVNKEPVVVTQAQTDKP